MTHHREFYTIFVVGDRIFPKFAAMKATNILLFLLGTLIIPLYLTSCGQDRWPEYAEQTKTDRWIDDTMRLWYYWDKDIPKSNVLNYFSEPFTFFKSLLSKKDGNGGSPFSTIDSITTATSRSIAPTDYSYGLEFELKPVKNNDTAYYARVLYAAHNSPASEASLKRGDWIMKMNNKLITRKNYARLYGDQAMELTVGYYDTVNDTIMAYPNAYNISGARSIKDNPVFYYNTYIKGNKRIGYLVYNHFSFGPSDNESDVSYNTELLNASNYFASQQVNEFVLDLRYNNGGYISCAQLLATILAPASALGAEMGYLEFNNQINPQTQSFYLDQNLISGGSNLNLSTLYILTTDETASASEMLINCLKPYMTIKIIGETTVGKNVGSKTFINSELQIAISPIVCKIYNTKGKSDYADGLTPDQILYESSNLANFLPFGNENELLLAKAIDLITGSSTSSIQTTPHSLKTTSFVNSIARRADKAVRIK